MIYRVFTERRERFRQENVKTLHDLEHAGVSIPGDLRIIQLYDVEGLDEAQFLRTIPLVFADPVKDQWTLAYDDLNISEENTLIAVESLPGQFDQRADSAMQCVQFVLGGERPEVRTVKLFVFSEKLEEETKRLVKEELINPIESRIASLAEEDHIRHESMANMGTERIAGFKDMVEGPEFWRKKLGLAMEEDDLAMVRDYFQSENREPSVTEIRMIDTYWSDHCRHTTFNTELTAIDFQDELVEETYKLYLDARANLGRTKPISLMDMGTLAAKELKKQGLLTNLDESEEINACTVKIKVLVEATGEIEDWLLLFKNETHNHPTEMEPFGGAATCLGGAIRDPLSGRAYVYQAMRVTGAADPYTTAEDTPEGKLTQRRIMQEAANGYSSYGNQVGVPSGLIDEIYHPGYLAKRLECGAVIGAVPENQVDRQEPIPGDLVLLLGAKTGRDGVGGATGSSKEQDTESSDSSAAEVQKGNAPEERSIMRLFRKADVSRKIKRCNDFGAGGVSVAIGELADGVSINLDAVPLKYIGLNGTEIAISESQERMAAVISAEDEAFFYQEAAKENVECTVVAVVTDEARVKMTWQGDTIVDLSREFLNTNGAHKTQEAVVSKARENIFPFRFEGKLQPSLESILKDYNIASKAGLIQKFDGTVGARTVLHPLGGKFQRTPVQAMVARIPRLGGGTDTSSIMAYAYNPYLSSHDEYAGAYLAVVESVAKVIATGGRLEEMWLSFQEYFQALGEDAAKWGSPIASVLGAYQAQKDLSLAAIGGKDSMSGSFEDIHVPPALISFAVSVSEGRKIVSPEYKQAGNSIIYLPLAKDRRYLPKPEALLNNLKMAQRLVQEERVVSASTVSYGGVIEQVFKGLMGNGLGLKFAEGLEMDKLFDWEYGSFVFEVESEHLEQLDTLFQEAGLTYEILGRLEEDPSIIFQEEVITLQALAHVWEDVLEDIYPTKLDEGTEASALREDWTRVGHSSLENYGARSILPQGLAKPRVVIPVFPGTNTEEESALAFAEAGADAQIIIVKNRKPEDIITSIQEMEEAIKSSQILFIPGGFSGGDEPDGSGKFINAFLRNPRLADAIHNLLDQRDGLVGGICNGFQALVKLGLLPYGRISEMNEHDPVLSENLIGRHQAMLIQSKITQNNSPWLSQYEIGTVETIAISHGEGQFLAQEETINRLFANGQVAAQYVDLEGKASMDIRYNPNSSMGAIEALISADGRVFGRMGHSERMRKGTLKNVSKEIKTTKLFKGAVEYFTKG